MRLVREVGRADHASTEQLSAFLDDRAEPEDRRFLTGHVEQCLVCANEMADLRSVRDMLRALPVYLPPRSFTIPVEPALPVRPFRRLIPLTRAFGALAAMLCVVLFSFDAMQSDYSAMSVPDGAGAMQITTRSTQDSAANSAMKPAESGAAARSAAESARPADVPKVANAPAPPPAPAAAAPAAKPAAAVAPAATPPAQPAGALARSSEPVARDANTPGQAPAESAPAAAAPRAPAAAPQQAAAPAAPQQAAPQQAQAKPAAPQPTIAGFAPGQPVVAPTIPAASTSAAAAARAPDSALPRPNAPPASSPWFTPIRLWSLAFALIAATLLIVSLVLSRLARARAGVRDEWSGS